MISKSNPLGSILLTFCLISLCTCLTFQLFNKDKIHYVTHVPDRIHRFVLINEEFTKPEYSEFHSTLPEGKNIQYYYYVCGRDQRDIVRICDRKYNSNLLLGYNKGTIQFENHLKGITQPELLVQLSKKINAIVRASQKKNIPEQQILQILAEKRQMILIVQNTTIKQFQLGVAILAKQFPFLDVVYITNPAIIEEYQLTVGDVLYIRIIQKQPILVKGDLKTILKNQTLVQTLNRQAPKKYDYMRMFVHENLFTKGFTKSLQGIQKQRFNQKPRKINQNGEYEQKRTVIVFCDLSQKCLNYWQKFDQQLLDNPFPAKANTDVKRLYYKVENLRNIQILQLYYHIKFSKKDLPYALILDGEDPEVPNLPVRYFKELSINKDSPLQQLKSFLNEIDEGKIDKFWMSSGIPKKNGFTGKGSEKYIQKLSYQTYKQVLAQAKLKDIYYFLYITATQIDCTQCAQFYNQLKKLGSFINADDELKVTIGLLDLSKDQIASTYFQSVPGVLFFTPYQEQPIQYNGRYQFDSVRTFMSRQINKAQNAKNKALQAQNQPTQQKEKAQITQQL